MGQPSEPVLVGELVRSTDISLADLWGPWRWPARVVLASFALTQALMAGSAAVTTGVVLPIIVDFVFFAVALLLLSMPWGATLPLGVTGVVVGLVAAMTLVEGEYGFSGTERFDDWYLGAAIIVLMALMMWGRVRAGWLAFAVLSVMQISLSLASGVGLEVTIPILMRHAGTLVVSTFMALSLTRVARLLSEEATRRRVRESTELIRTAVARERDEQFQRLDAIAGDVLRRITLETPLDEAERTECLLIEATLRDRMSGRGFATTEVLAAARAARERGARVVLLDDAHGENPHASHAAEQLVPLLSALESGSCTARLLPPGRDVVASILVDSGTEGAQVIEVAAPDH